MRHINYLVLSKWFILGLFIFLVIPSLAVAISDKKPLQSEILVIGTGIIQDGNIANAREAAVSEALVKGVEAYLARRLGSKGMINNFPRIIHDIIPKAGEEIENYNILAEEQIDKYFKILVKVKVNENVIEEMFREMGLVSMEGPPIKILFLVSQISSPGGMISYWWKTPESHEALTPTELSLYRVFQERGFQPINRMITVPERDYPSEMMALDLSDETVINWGRIFSADVVIYGKCMIVEGENISVLLKSFDVEEGEMISQDSQVESIEGVPPDRTDLIMQGIERTVNHLATRLSPEIIKRFKEQEAIISFFEITLKGLKSFKQLREFEDFLKKDIPGVGLVRLTRVKGNTVSLSVAFSGSKDKFLDAVISHENFPFQADLSRSEEGEIIFHIIR